MILLENIAWHSNINTPIKRGGLQGLRKFGIIIFLIYARLHVHEVPNYNFPNTDCSTHYFTSKIDLFQSTQLPFYDFYKPIHILI